MMQLRALVFAAALATAIPAFATPQHLSATGLWIDPNESGWGLNLFHQGTTVFAALFVYGVDGQPRWYTASNMVDAGDGPVHDHMTLVTGDLFEATGPYFGGTFDPSRVARHKVGTMTIDLGNTLSVVTYTIDGVQVQKQVRPFTFRAENLAGDYRGYLWQPQASEFSTGPEIRDDVHIHIGDNGGSVTMTTNNVTGGGCSYSGTGGQNRDFATVDGLYDCFTSKGNWFMSVDVTPDGIVGSFNGAGVTGFWGRIAAARTANVVDGGTGANNDLYFPPNESGWGVNFLEQGDTGFATLFVYDQQGKSHWYSASNLHRAGPNENDFYDYVGDLQESTGPYYGTSFNPAAVTRRTVGTMVFEPHKDGTARLTYTVNGVQVDKIVSRFAMAKNSLAGNYIGHIVGIAPGASAEAVTLAIDDSADPVVINTTSSRGTCRYSSPIMQRGELRELAGSFSCSDGRGGTFKMNDVNVQWSGFNGSFDSTDIRSGKIEGLRTDVN